MDICVEEEAAEDVEDDDGVNEKVEAGRTTVWEDAGGWVRHRLTYAAMLASLIDLLMIMCK